MKLKLVICAATLALAACSGGDDNNTNNTSSNNTSSNNTSSNNTTSDNTNPNNGGGNVAGSCDNIAAGDTCNEIPAGVTDAELESVVTNCPGEWKDGVPCPDGWTSGCVDFEAGILQSQYYYNGNAGMGEAMCTMRMGTWESELPDYAGSCQQSDTECWNFVGDFDTPATVQESCDGSGGTYLAEECSTDNLAAVCDQSPFKIYHYYMGHADLAAAETFCGQIGATWETF